MNPVRWITQLLGHFYDQKTPKARTEEGDQNAEYDDRQSMLPFIKEEQRLERLTHQRHTDEHKDDTPHQRELVRWTRNLAYTTGALALATFGVACFAGWQAWEMRKGSVDTARLADAASRPYLFNKFSDANSIHLWIMREGLIGVHLVIMNYGQAPAIVTDAHCAPVWGVQNDADTSLLVDDRSKPFDFAPGTVVGNNKDSIVVYCSGAWPMNFWAVGYESSWDTQQILRVIHDHPLWLTARVDYEDVSGVSHETTTCARYDLVAGARSEDNHAFETGGGPNCQQRW